MALKISNNIKRPELPDNGNYEFITDENYVLKQGDAFWINYRGGLGEIEFASSFAGDSYKELNKEWNVIFVAAKIIKNKPKSIGRFIELKPFPHGY